MRPNLLRQILVFLSERKITKTFTPKNCLKIKMIVREDFCIFTALQNAAPTETFKSAAFCSAVKNAKFEIIFQTPTIMCTNRQWTCSKFREKADASFTLQGKH